MEILAPAGSPELLYAAVEAGADAVYLGGKLFSARRFAGNFTNEEMEEAVHFCHARNVAVYVTLNTLIADQEMKDAVPYLRFLDSIAIDGLLVQDLGVARLAHEIVPNLPLHASTQMTVSNLAGVKFLESLNFRRVVLSRELSLEEIEYIANNCDVEIEIFVHGALCVCYSGQCLMSSFIGGRSGNRGACAQPCRMPYNLTNASGEPFPSQNGKYLISLKDMSGLEDIERLAHSRVASLKIEGRMKSPEYVYDVVSSYRTALDMVEEGKKPDLENLKKRLERRFYRGFTAAYYHDRPGADMMTGIIPGNRGVEAGRVLSAKHHSFTFKDTYGIGREEILGISYIGKNKSMIFVPEKDISRDKGNRYSCLVETQPEENSMVYWQIKEDKYHISPAHSQRKRVVDFAVYAMPDAPLQLLMTDRDNHMVSLESPAPCQKALKRVTTREEAEKQLGRLGDTPFALGTVHLENDGCMIPRSVLNELRQQATAKLTTILEKEFVQKTHNFKDHPVHLPDVPQAHFSMKPQISVRAETVEQVEEALRAGAGEIVFGGESYHHRAIPLSDYEKAVELAHNAQAKIIFAAPRLLRGKHTERYLKQLKQLTALHPDAMEISFLGQMDWVNEYMKGIPLVGGASLNIFNTDALRTVEGLGFSGQALSPELTISQIHRIAQEARIPVSATVYGRSEMMVSEYCAIEAVLTNGEKKKCPGVCMKDSYFFKDKEGHMFPLKTDEYCHMHILNSRILDMRPYVHKLVHAGLNRLCVDVRAGDEPAYSLVKFFVDILSGRKEAPSAESSGEITRGHFLRGVL